METAGGVVQPRRLYNLMQDAFHKIMLRARRPPNPAKWPLDAIDEHGNRDWRKCSQGFLWGKLMEEVAEFRETLSSPHISSENIRFEGADVAAVAMMLVDHSMAYETLPPIPRIVCLCGSTRFYDAYMKANAAETMKGNIVLSVGFFMHHENRMKKFYEALSVLATYEGHPESFRSKAREALTNYSHPEGAVGISEEEKIQLDQLHMRKIDLADEILVINVDGYIGNSTRNEINYAAMQGKPIRYLEQP